MTVYELRSMLVLKTATLTAARVHAERPQAVRALSRQKPPQTLEAP